MLQRVGDGTLRYLHDAKTPESKDVGRRRKSAARAMETMFKDTHYAAKRRKASKKHSEMTDFGVVSVRLWR